MQCKACSGSGKVSCVTCSGSGRLAEDANVVINSGSDSTMNDFQGDDGVAYHAWVTCPDCSSGNSTCTACNGSGEIPE